MALMPGTHFVLPDEKAHYLVERNLMAPDYKGVHRYQVIYVYRGDALAEWRDDLGLASAFTAAEFRVPSLGEHTVAELQAIAEELRLGDERVQRRTQELAAESTLISQWFDQVEERRNLINNRSVVGPGYAKQRNGFSLATALETGRNR